MLLSPAFYLLAVIAILIVGISKGGFGGGLGMVAVPLMSLVISPFDAAAILLPMLCIMDVAGLRAYWKRWDPQNLWIILPGGILGVLVATLTYRWVDEQMLRLLIGVIAVAFALNYYSQAWRRERPARQASRVSGGFWSAVAGFTSFSAHAGGPPISVYLLPQRLDKTLFVGTTVVFFAFVNYIKLVPYALLGQFRPEILLNALLLAPVAVAGVYLGLWLHHHLSERWFYRLCYALLLLTGLRLLQQGLAG